MLFLANQNFENNNRLWAQYPKIFFQRIKRPSQKSFEKARCFFEVSQPRAKVQFTEMDNELARIEKLKGLENWGTWKFQVKILVQAADALEIISQRERRETETADGNWNEQRRVVS